MLRIFVVFCLMSPLAAYAQEALSRQVVQERSDAIASQIGQLTIQNLTLTAQLHEAKDQLAAEKAKNAPLTEPSK